MPWWELAAAVGCDARLNAFFCRAVCQYPDPASSGRPLEEHEQDYVRFRLHCFLESGTRVTRDLWKDLSLLPRGHFVDQMIQRGIDNRLITLETIRRHPGRRTHVLWDNFWREMQPRGLGVVMRGLLSTDACGHVLSFL